MSLPQQAVDLLARAHRLGADRTTTNYAGGNASCKAAEVDPVTGTEVDVLFVKGSGGDLATLQESGLAVLRLDRLRALRDVFEGPAQDDEMVTALDHCLFGRGGAAPSIDTAMHGLLEAAHVDHLHPEAGLAFATARDGERLTHECFGDRVVWVPWRRPGFQLACDIADARRESPEAIGAVLGGHGITAWGETSAECEHRSRAIIDDIESYLAEHGTARPFGAALPQHDPLPTAERQRRLVDLLPTLRRLMSTDGRRVLHVCDDDVVLELLAGSEHARLVQAGTSCPDHFLRTRVRPMLLDLPPSAELDAVRSRLVELHADYRADYAAYYHRHAGSGTARMRGADPTVVLLPGLGMVTAGPDAFSAQVTAEYYLNAVHAIRGAESVSRYEPIDEAQKFAIEYWDLEEAKLRRQPPPPVLGGRVAVVTGAGSGIGRATALRLAEAGAAVALLDLDVESAERVAAEAGRADGVRALRCDVSDEQSVEDAVAAAVLAFGGVDVLVNNAGLSLSRDLLETTAADWDRQHAVMSRGSFLMARAVARVLVEQERGGDIVYVASKNAVVAGPKNLAYGAAKADQAHQVRLLAAELGPHGVRVNGVNPDGVVRGSGIFENGWGADRAAAYGVPEDELGAYYASRTLLGREVLPEHVADAVLTILGGGLDRTTGLLVPVDAGVSAAFLR